MATEAEITPGRVVYCFNVELDEDVTSRFCDLVATVNTAPRDGFVDVLGPHGTQHSFGVRRVYVEIEPRKCEVCEGGGVVPENHGQGMVEWLGCQDCQGTGLDVIECEHCAGAGEILSARTIGTINGTSKVVDHDQCQHCTGLGLVDARWGWSREHLMDWLDGHAMENDQVKLLISLIVALPDEQLDAALAKAIGERIEYDEIGAPQ